MEKSIKQKFIILMAIPVVLIFGIIFTYPKDSELVEKDLDLPQYNTLLDFKQLIKPSMKIAQIIDIFGEPENDIGSGVHIYVYPVEDSGRVLIGYSDKIIYVNHESSNGLQSRVIEVPVTEDTSLQSGDTSANVTIANPASTYCTETGGKLEIKKDTYGGEIGYCTLPSGEVCDEWAYYRKICGSH